MIMEGRMRFVKRSKISVHFKDQQEYYRISLLENSLELSKIIPGIGNTSVLITFSKKNSFGKAEYYLTKVSSTVEDTSQNPIVCNITKKDVAQWKNLLSKMAKCLPFYSFKLRMMLSRASQILDLVVL